MVNITRSVERVRGVKRAAFNLERGEARIWFAEGKSVKPMMLWAALKGSGFTPDRLVVHGKTYRFGA
ncbi:MAG: heavy-metal-associated domain-containing protein [Planctomycetota bacterium]|nr:MAG: heavy-metal-associated domain-containing protein [Planctomycetota bacterium]